MVYFFLKEFWYPWSYFKWFGDHTIRIWWANNGENANSTNPISGICVKFVGWQNTVYMVKSNILCCKTCFETSNFLFLTIGMSSYKHYLPGTHPENRIFGHFEDLISLLKSLRKYTNLWKNEHNSNPYNFWTKNRLDLVDGAKRTYILSKESIGRTFRYEFLLGTHPRRTFRCM